jgi:CarD family transcriptional regulator, regulator of rRNA transcription
MPNPRKTFDLREFYSAEFWCKSIDGLCLVCLKLQYVLWGRGLPPMEFKLGEKVVYPNHGVGVIEQISYGYVNGKSERFYMLKIVSSGLKVMVPQSNIQNVGLRPIIRSTQAGEVLSFLEKGRSASHHDWKHRFKENSDRMRTGSLMEVAAVLKGLVALSRTKPLSFREKKMLERAKYLLVSELATVRNTSEQAVETNIARALAKAKLQMPETAAGQTAD